MATELFRSIFSGGSSSSRKARHVLANKTGQSFLSIAAARLNFWVIRLALTEAPYTASLLQKPDNSGNTPLHILRRRMAEAAAEPTRPRLQGEREEAKLPPWCLLSRCKPMLIADGVDPPLFSDLVLEVEDASAPGGLVRVAGHRVVIGACSDVLDGQIRKLSHGGRLRVDSLCCRSGEVLLALLHFCYSGEIRLSFREDAFLLWQMLCLCVQYALSIELTKYVRSALVSSLWEPRHAAVVPVLLQAADKVSLTEKESCLVAYALLANPEAALVDVLDDARRAQVLVTALGDIEKHVLSAAGQMKSQTSGSTGSQPPPTPAMRNRDV